MSHVLVLLLRRLSATHASPKQKGENLIREKLQRMLIMEVVQKQHKIIEKQNAKV